MHRYLLTTILIMLLGVTAWAQGQEAGVNSEDEPADETRVVEPTGDDEVEDEIDAEVDAELEQESYADAEEEDFVPTEDIPTDQAIPFPTDI
jgi:hypothetical protein